MATLETYVKRFRYLICNCHNLTLVAFGKDMVDTKKRSLLWIWMWLCLFFSGNWVPDFNWTTFFWRYTRVHEKAIGLSYLELSLIFVNRPYDGGGWVMVQSLGAGGKWYSLGVCISMLALLNYFTFEVSYLSCCL